MRTFSFLPDSWRRFAARLPSLGILVAFGLLLLYVGVDVLNRSSFPEILRRRAFPDWKAGKLLSTAWNFTLFTGFSFLLVSLLPHWFPKLRKPHWAFMLCASLLCPVYMLLFTIYSVPDEMYHYSQTLIRAAALTRTSQLDESYLFTEFKSHSNSTDGYLLMRHVFKRTPPVGVDVDIPAREPARPGEAHDHENLEYDPLFLHPAGNALHYVSQTAGLALGLSLGLPPAACFYLGRFTAVLFYILAMTLAIRISPVLKQCLAVVALTPIALQQACSYSYDNETLVCCFLCFAFFLKVARESAQPLSVWEKLAVCALVACGMAIKGTALPFLPLLLFIPASRFKTGNVGKVLFLAAIAALSVCTIMVSVKGVEFGAMPDGKPALGCWDLARHPLHFAHMLCNTLDKDLSGCRLALSAFGFGMSGLSIWLPLFHPLLFVVFFVAAARLDDDTVPRPLRHAAAFGFLLVTASTVTAMITTWTPARATQIMGLQGRYWTPVLPLLALALFTKRRRCATETAPAAPAAPETIGKERFLFPSVMAAHLAVVTFVIKQSILRGF